MLTLSTGNIGKLDFCGANVLVKACLLLPFSRYCCSKVGRYYQPPSGAQGAKGLISVFSNSLFNSNFKDCSWKFVISVLNGFWFLLFVMSFHYSNKHFVEVRNTRLNSACLFFPPHIKNEQWISRKNDNSVKIMIKTQIL